MKKYSTLLSSDQKQSLSGISLWSQDRDPDSQLQSVLPLHKLISEIPFIRKTHEIASKV